MSTSPALGPREAPSPLANGGVPTLDLAILGGGISGLALGAFAVKSGLTVAVLDRAQAPGGVMGSVREDGFLFELGPNTVLDRDPSLPELLEWAGLADRTIRVPLRGMQRYIRHGSRMHPVPGSPLSALTTGLFSPAGKLRVLREPFIPPVTEDEPLRDFVIRRLGREAYERALVPMVSGISGGDPARMSTEHSFPILKDLERRGGGLFRGLLARRSEPASRPRAAAHMITFPEGLGEIPLALAERLGEDWRPGVDVRTVSLRPDGGFRVGTDAGPMEAAQVALCADADSVADWVAPLSPGAAALLRKVHYCPLAVVGLGVEASSLNLPPGFGFLTTAAADVRVLGAIFNSGFFPGRAPAGHHVLTVMLGSDRDPEALNLSDKALVEQVRGDLARALSWDGKARSIRIQRWARAIPQYGLGHGELLASLDLTESRLPGLHFLGNWRGGAAVGERIRLAREAVDKILRKKADKAP